MRPDMRPHDAGLLGVPDGAEARNDSCVVAAGAGKRAAKRTLGELFDGSDGAVGPAVLYDDGGKLLSAARQQGIASLQEVRLAILEPEGHFTFIRRSGEQQNPPDRREP